MKISIGIITRDRLNLLKKCVNSILNNSILPYEIVIVNNGSNNAKLTAYLNKIHQKISLKVFLEKKIGRAFARQKLFKNFQGEVLVTLDDDCLVDKYWINNIILSHKTHNNINIIQGSTKSIHKFKIIQKAIQESYDLWILRNKNRNYLNILDTKNCSFKRKIAKNVTFDTKMVLEDVDLANQLIKNGEKILYVPKIKVCHQEKNNIFELIEQRIRMGKFKCQIENKWSRIESINIGKYPKYNFLNTIILKFPFFLGYFLEKIKFENNFALLKKTTYSQKKELKFNTLDVLIITKNRINELNSCLKSLDKQVKYINKIIIIDSSDKKQKIFKTSIPINYIKTKTFGFSNCRNLAIKESRSDIVAFLDDDESVDQNWAKNILISHNIYNDFLAIQGRVISQFTSIWGLNEMIDYENWIIRSINQSNSNINVISTKNISFKRNIFLKNKFSFYETKNINKFGGEDVILSQNIKKKGFCIKFDPNILAFHKERTNLFDYLKQQARKTIFRKIYNKKTLQSEKIFFLEYFLRIFITPFKHPFIKKNFFIYPFIILLRLFILFFKSFIYLVIKNEN